MKRIIVILCCFLSTVILKAQKIIEGSVDCLTSVRVVNLVIDYSQLIYRGMTEQEFASIDPEWDEAKACFLRNIALGANSKTTAEYDPSKPAKVHYFALVPNQNSAKYTAIFIPIKIDESPLKSGHF